MTSKSLAGAESEPLVYSYAVPDTYGIPHPDCKFVEFAQDSPGKG